MLAVMVLALPLVLELQDKLAVEAFIGGEGGDGVLRFASHTYLFAPIFSFILSHRGLILFLSDYLFCDSYCMICFAQPCAVCMTCIAQLRLSSRSLAYSYAAFSSIHGCSLTQLGLVFDSCQLIPLGIYTT
jgi:hypothetical protein